MYYVVDLTDKTGLSWQTETTQDWVSLSEDIRNFLAFFTEETARVAYLRALERTPEHHLEVAPLYEVILKEQWLFDPPLSRDELYRRAFEEASRSKPNPYSVDDIRFMGWKDGLASRAES